ncbi:Uu.00g123440.m01.CDS01 [Anthostomella pinea]|uniref:Uu.00g123440.m01.CDS01 n=1 Tax=Anthostomella pinea TaxID=933095 RepID=A0AAI8YHE4_9PEZI|nr:Uu.00g123440.m01.CDS01 [Anthostomella pinea]
MRVAHALAILAACLATQAKRPNILFILTDDQDWHMESVEHMQSLKSDIVNKGASFDRHFCTVALCCPSRATLCTGRAAHNHNVTKVSPPHGGYPKVVDRGINDDYLPIWMQEAGYNTYYSGKLWNFHNVNNYNSPYVKGYNSSDFLLDPYTYRYWDSKMTHNDEARVSYAGKYSTDAVADKAYALLDEALSHEEPWFLTVSPIAPHSNWVFDEKTNTSYLSMPQSAYRHEHLFNDYQIPRGKSFNSAIEGGASWWRQRLRALQAVDEMVHELVEKLADDGELDNTYSFYTTDNGYTSASTACNRVRNAATVCDTDIHVPLFVRGPGVAAGAQFDSVTTHTDIAPTLLRIANADKQLDGENFEAGIHFGLYPNNTYKGLRLAGDGFSVYYSVWCTGERELFDLRADPEQTLNLLSEAGAHAASRFAVSGRPISDVVPRLDALMMVLKDCKDRTCMRPWGGAAPRGRRRIAARGPGPPSTTRSTRVSRR